MSTTYTIKTTAVQRVILQVALANQKKLAQDQHSGLGRLGKSQAIALEAQGECEYLLDEVQKIDIGEKDEKTLDILNKNAATQLRFALINYARQAIKRNKSAEQLALSTNVTQQEKHVQAMLDAISDQLSLPIQSIDDLVKESDAGPTKEDKDAADTKAAAPEKKPSPVRAVPKPSAKKKAPAKKK